jgi:PEP-CTERM motif
LTPRVVRGTHRHGRYGFRPPRATVLLRRLHAGAAQAAVTIDGTLGDGEWTEAAVYDIGTNPGYTGPSTGVAGKAYLRADQNYLYACLDLTAYTTAANMDHGDLIGISAQIGNGVFKMPDTATAWAQVTEALSGSGRGTPSGTIDGGRTAWYETKAGLSLSLPTDLLITTSFATGHRVTEIQLPLLGLGALHAGDTIYASGIENFNGGMHFLPDTLSATWDSRNYAAITVVPEPATMSLLALGGIATLIRRRRKA